MIKEKSEKKVSLRLPLSLYEEVAGFADSFGLSFAEAVKMILRKGLQYHESKI